MAVVDPLVQALIAERERLGWGVRETARHIGIGHYPGRLSEWELGYNSPTLPSLRKWAAGLGLDLALVTLSAIPTHTTEEQP
jgi:transcriptional regulator with XRE-family HTH domain